MVPDFEFFVLSSFRVFVINNKKIPKCGNTNITTLEDLPSPQT